MHHGQPSASERIKTTELKVLVGLALDANDETVWPEGVRLVRETPHAELHVCHVVEDVDGAIASASDSSRKSSIETRQRALVDFVRGHLVLEPPRSWLRTVVHIGLGKPADELAQIATDIEADCIVVGAVGERKLREMLIGSVAAELFKSSPCTVSLARPKVHEAQEKTPEVEPPPPPGGGVATPAHTYRYRRRLEMRQPDAQVVPTGLPTDA